MDHYFMLECVAPEDWDDPALVEGIPPPIGEASWRLGRRFKVEPHLPVVVNLHADYGVQLKELRNVDALLMTRRLHQALVAAGVGNLDAYPAIVRHAGRSFETADYVACNLIGLVPAANIRAATVDNSQETGPIDADVEGVAIDERAAAGALMFRLAENTSAVVVHRSVRAHLLAEGFDMLTFVPAREWIG